MLEAIDLIAEISGHQLNYTLSDAARSGDHIWWISDVRRFQQDYPDWAYTYDLRATLSEMISASEERYRSEIKHGATKA
jgi:CDP-paratose 2-epimerase